MSYKTKLFQKVIFTTINILLLLIIFIPQGMSLALSHEWQEVPSSQSGRQWWDKESLKINNDGTFRILSKYEANLKGSNNIYNYTMDIDCFEKSYKDISINKVETNQNKMLKANGDILIEGVINQVCSIA
mgnify:CR=1 FL=1|tara:strand:- start:15217 stop:15606 length:390 start_codon:yes stop_codon:yes gene_type:complete